MGLLPIRITERQCMEGAKTMHGSEAAKRSYAYEKQSELSEWPLLPTTYRHRRVENAWEEATRAAGTKIVNIGRWHPEPPHEVPRAYRLVETSRPWENADIYRSANRLTTNHWRVSTLCHLPALSVFFVLLHTLLLPPTFLTPS